MPARAAPTATPGSRAGIWAATFDAVALRVAEDNELQLRAMSTMSGPMIPCCVCCIMCKVFGSLGELQASKQQSDQAWLTVAQNEQATYAPYGIHVSLATEMRVHSTGSGSMRNVSSTLANVGLKFEAADFAMPAVDGAAVVVAAVPEPQTIERTDMASELEKLAKLHATGALTEGEFTTAKAKLLGGQSP